METLLKSEPKTNKLPVNPTLKTIYERRAMRKYTGKPIEKSILGQIIDAGRMAPSAINKQPWRFYILTDKELIKSLSKEISKAAIKGIAKSGIKQIIKSAKDFIHFSHGSDFLKAEDPVFHGAPAVVFITSPKDNEWAALDIGMCSQNMMLAAKSLGIDSCPVGFGKFVEQTKSYPILKITGKEKVHLALIFGYGDEYPEVKERIKNNVIYL